MHLAILLLVVELGKGFCGSFCYYVLPPVCAPCYPNVYLPKHKLMHFKNTYHRVIDKLAYVLILTKEIQYPHELQMIIGDVLSFPGLHLDFLWLFELFVVVLTFFGPFP